MFSNVVVGVIGRAGAGNSIAITKLLTLEPYDASIKAEVMRCAAASVGPGLHELDEREDADGLVVGSRNRGLLGQIFLSDDTLESLNGAAFTVAIPPRGPAENADRLVNVGVSYDGSPESRRALDAAPASAARHVSAVRALSLVSIQDTPYGEPINHNLPELDRKLADDSLKSLSDVGDVAGDATYGGPSEELVRFSVEVRPLIVGPRGHRPLGRLLNGSTANHPAGTLAVGCTYSSQAPPRASSPALPASTDKLPVAASSGP